jgi:ribosome-associated protein
MKPTPSPHAAAAQERPSKTQLKKAMHELQALGEALLHVPEARLQAVAMPQALRDALQELRRTRSHEGRRRQLQYVGKLMRGVDAQPLREVAAAAQLAPARETLALHEAERWRDRLLASDEAMTAWTAAHPQSDTQALRALIRNARREAAGLPRDTRREAAPTQPPAGSAGQAPRKGRAYRELFKALSQALRGTPALPSAASAAQADDHAQP